MNWKVLGATLTYVSIAVLIAGLSASSFADREFTDLQKAQWGLDCLRGSYEACGTMSRHNEFVAMWKEYGTYAAVAAGVLLVIGIAILAGAYSSSKQSA